MRIPLGPAGGAGRIKHLRQRFGRPVEGGQRRRAAGFGQQIVCPGHAALPQRRAGCDAARPCQMFARQRQHETRIVVGDDMAMFCYGPWPWR